jgi:hypothetical protein
MRGLPLPALQTRGYIIDTAMVNQAAGCDQQLPAFAFCPGAATRCKEGVGVMQRNEASLISVLRGRRLAVPCRPDGSAGWPLFAVCISHLRLGRLQSSACDANGANLI